MLIPEVVGFKLTGKLPEGATATDLVLTVTQMLRKKGVVEKFVEFYGPGLDQLSLADRATIANMAPEYGATMGFFPVDDETLDYLRQTGRDETQIELVERYCKAQGLFRTDDTPTPSSPTRWSWTSPPWSPVLAGPKRPQDRVRPQRGEELLHTSCRRSESARPPAAAWPRPPRPASQTRLRRHRRHHLLHQHLQPHRDDRRRPAGQEGGREGPAAQALGQDLLAPGSQVVTDYLNAGGVLRRPGAARLPHRRLRLHHLHRQLRRLPEDVAKAIADNDLVVAAVLSGNRNFEGRINPLVKANYLASPMLVVAYALAGTVDIDLHGAAGHRHRRQAGLPEGHLADATQEIARPSTTPSSRRCSASSTARVFDGDENWQAAPGADRRPLRVGRRLHLHPGAAVLHRDGHRRPARSRTSSAPSAARWSATPSPPTTSPRPAPSPRTAPPAEYLHGERRRAESTSTPTAPAAATTRS